MLFLLLFDFLHHAGPAGSMAGWKAKAADAGAVGEKVPVGQQVSDAIPAEYHRPICWPLQLLLALQFQALVLVRLALLAPLAAAGTSMGAGTTILQWLPLLVTAGRILLVIGTIGARPGLMVFFHWNLEFFGTKNPAGAEGQDRLHEQVHHAGCTPSSRLP